MKDWVAIAVLLALLIAMMVVIDSCDPDEGDEDDGPVEPIPDED